MGAVGVGKTTFGKVAQTHMVVTVAIDNTAVLTGTDLKNIYIAGMQFGESKGAHFVDSVLAIVVHHIVQNHHPIGIGIHAWVQS